MLFTWKMRKVYHPCRVTSSYAFTPFTFFTFCNLHSPKCFQSWGSSPTLGPLSLSKPDTQVVWSKQQHKRIISLLTLQSLYFPSWNSKVFYHQPSFAWVLLRKTLQGFATHKQMLDPYQQVKVWTNKLMLSSLGKTNKSNNGQIFQVG